MTAIAPSLHRTLDSDVDSADGCEVACALFRRVACSPSCVTRDAAPCALKVTRIATIQSTVGKPCAPTGCEVACALFRRVAWSPTRRVACAASSACLAASAAAPPSDAGTCQNVNELTCGEAMLTLCVTM
jgi:hypothetical protein